MNKSRHPAFWWIIAGAIAVVALPRLLILPAPFEWMDISSGDKVGSAVDGLTAPILGLISAWLIYLAFHEQYIASQDNKRESDFRYFNAQIDRLEDKLENRSRGNRTLVPEIELAAHYLYNENSTPGEPNSVNPNSIARLRVDVSQFAALARQLDDLKPPNRLLAVRLANLYRILLLPYIDNRLGGLPITTTRRECLVMDDVLRISIEFLDGFEQRNHDVKGITG